MGLWDTPILAESRQNRGCSIALDTYALTSVANLRDQLGLADDQPTAEAFSIYHDAGTSSTAATITITDTTLSLTITGGANAGTDSFTLANASYDTMAELTAAITALAKGWQVILLCPSATSSTLLIPRASTSVWGQAATIRPTYTDAAHLENIINRASAKVETYLDRKILTRSYYEWHNVNHDTINLRNYPVTAVARVAYGSAVAVRVTSSVSTDVKVMVEVQDDKVVINNTDSTGADALSNLPFDTYRYAGTLATAIDAQTGFDATLVNNCATLDLHRLGAQNAKDGGANLTYPDRYASGYYVNEDTGQLVFGSVDDGWGDELSACYPRGRTMVQYTGGYSTVPYDIEQVVLELAQAMYHEVAADPTAQSESLGNYSYTSSTGGGSAAAQLTVDMKARLHEWRRIR